MTYLKSHCDFWWVILIESLWLSHHDPQWVFFLMTHFKSHHDFQWVISIESSWPSVSHFSNDSLQNIERWLIESSWPSVSHSWLSEQNGDSLDSFSQIPDVASFFDVESSWPSVSHFSSDLLQNIENKSFSQLSHCNLQWVIFLMTCCKTLEGG